MPKNPRLFPESFVLDSAATESGIGALEVAVTNLSTASKASAMRQAHALGAGGRNSIKNQNRGMPTLNSLLPTRSVGKYTILPSALSGTVGYFIAGTGDSANGRDITQQQTRVDRFTFATNVVVSLGSRLNANGFYTFGNTQFGYYGFNPTFGRIFERFTFQTENTSPIGSNFFPARYLGASLSSQSRGYACGGCSSFGGVIYGNIDRFSFAGEICVSIANSLQQSKRSSFGFGNKFNGYVAGGLATPPNIANTIERFSYAAETATVISAVTNPGRASVASWIPGSSLAAYIYSGDSYGAFPNAGSGARTYHLNTIDKFTFTGETCGVLGTTLARGLAGYAAVGNATRCVIGGGLQYTDAYNVQVTFNQEMSEMTAITYSTETVTTLSCTLSIGRRNLGGLDNNGV